MRVTINGYFFLNHKTDTNPQCGESAEFVAFKLTVRLLTRNIMISKSLT